MTSNSRPRVLGTFILSVLISCQKCCASPTSGKLDFGDSSSQNPLVILEEKPSPSNNVKHTTIIDNISVPSENAHIISCVTTGCNVTNPVNDTVETLVVLQIKTKVNLDRNAKGDEFNSKDVPITVGFNSPGLDQTLDDRNRPNDFKSRSDFDIDSFRHDSRFIPSYHDLTSYFERHNIARPGINRNVADNNRPNDFRSRLGYDLDHNRFPPSSYRFNARSGQPNIARPPYSFTSRPEYNVYPPRNEHDHNIYSHYRDVTPNPFLSTGGRSYPQSYDGSYSKENKYDYDRPYSFLRNTMNTFLNRNSEVNINVKSLSPLAVTVTDKDGSNNFEQNGIELRVPHFEPTANKHYFGDDSPPHSLLVSKNSVKNPVAFNPVAFKTNNNRPNNNRPFGYLGQASNRKFSSFGPSSKPYNLTPDGHRRNGCLCKDQNMDASVKRSVHVDGKINPISYSDPGEKISGKLDFLN